MTTQQSDEELALFSRLFKGFEGAHGQYDENNHLESSGKLLGKPTTHKVGANAKDYARHLAGAVSIGIIPLMQDETCFFGAIDVDIKGETKLHETHEELESKIRKYKLPLMLFRSKSNGAHLYLFSKEPMSARLMQGRLMEFAAVLGYGGCEVFPKQVTRLKRDDTDFGNWINLPLFGDTRKAIFEGQELDRLTALKTCDYLSVTEKELRAFSVNQSELFSDGPPCLQQIATVGIGEGNRNSTLFNVGIYLKLKYEDDWQEELQKFNEEQVDPPISNAEMNELFKQISRKDYFYTCKNPPICNHCDKKKCLKRKYGIGGGGNDEESFVLPITGITKYIAGDRQSYRWGVSTTEAILDFSTEELLNIEAHRRKFAELMNIIIPNIKAKEFNNQLQKLLNNCEIVYDPEDASETGELIANIESWFVDKGGARNVDEMMKRIWWRNPDLGHIYFIGAHLIDYLVHQKKMRNINRHKLWRLLEERFKADRGKIVIKGKRRNVYIIKDYEFEDDSPLDTPEVDRKEESI